MGGRHRRLDSAGVGIAGLLYDGASAGTASANTITGVQLGVQLIGESSPLISANVIESAGAASFLVDGMAAPDLQANTCAVGVPGIAIAGDATPEIADDQLDCTVLRQ